jgi:hypothetical protein
VEVWRVAATEGTGPREHRQPRGTLHAVEWAGKNPPCGRSTHGLYLFLFDHEFATIDGDRCPACVELTAERPPPQWAPNLSGR